MDFTDHQQDNIVAALTDMLQHASRLLLNVEPDAQRFIQSFTQQAQRGLFPFLQNFHINSDDELRCTSRMIAIQIWNVSPLPSQQYQQKVIATPKRNDPCWCGSGRKYKQCCLAMAAKEGRLVSQDIMTSMILHELTQKELKTVWQYLPHPLLGHIASEWQKIDATRAKRALLMLDPIFKQHDQQLHHHDDFALDVLLDLCTQLNMPRKKSTLLKRMVKHPNKILCGTALQRQCCILGDQGKDDEAWSCFQQLQRLSPNDPNLSHLELMLLMQQGKVEQMQQRGQFWIKRLTQLNQHGELDDMIGMIGKMITDSPSAFGEILESQTTGVLRLINWSQKMLDKPPALIQKLDCQNDLYWTEPISPEMETIFFSWNELMYAHEDDMWNNPEPWLSQLEQHPELAGNISVLDNLLSTIHELDTPNPNVVFQPLIQLALHQVRQLLPKNPTANLEWGIMENRPILRTLNFLAMYFMNTGKVGDANNILAWAVKLCPNDNLGCRFLLVNSLLQQQQNQQAIKLCEKYPDDHNTNICFGYALALFRENQHEQATAALRSAAGSFPKVVTALTRKTMKPPKGLQEAYITYGGDDEAWYYREQALELWQSTPKALAWLKQCSK